MTATRIIRVQMPGGLVAVTAAPTPTPGLMINESPAFPGSWTITHLASGTAIANHFDNPEHALHLAIKFGPLCDWTLTGAELYELLPGLEQKWLSVLEEEGALEMRPAGMRNVSLITAMEPLS